MANLRSMEERCAELNMRFEPSAFAPQRPTNGFPLVRIWATQSLLAAQAAILEQRLSIRASGMR